jgi:hypothetical protein
LIADIRNPICRHGSSRVPIGVSGLHRAIRFKVRQLPRIMPSRVITVSAYRLHDGVNRQRIPIRSAIGASA